MSLKSFFLIFGCDTYFSSDLQNALKLLETDQDNMRTKFLA